MKIPRIFVPEDRDLEENIQRLLNEDYSNILPPNLRNIEIESNLGKPVYRFEESLNRLKKSGYDRHLRPYECFSLIVDHLKGNLEKKHEILLRDMISGNSGEWLSMAVKKEKDRLICFVDPENIMWDVKDTRYVIDGELKYSHVEEFDIPDRPAGGWMRLDLFDADVINFFYGCEFQDLPQDMQEGVNDSRIYMPFVDDVIWPISRGRYNFKFGLDLRTAHPTYSLGVKVKPSKK